MSGQPLLSEDAGTAAMARNSRVEIAINAVAGTATPAPGVERRQRRGDEPFTEDIFTPDRILAALGG